MSPTMSARCWTLVNGQQCKREMGHIGSCQFSDRPTGTEHATAAAVDLASQLEALRSDVERLTRERDEARAALVARSEDDWFAEMKQQEERAGLLAARASRLEAALREIRGSQSIIQMWSIARAALEPEKP